MLELGDGALTHSLCELARIGVNARDADHKLEIQLMAGVEGPSWAGWVVRRWGDRLLLEWERAGGRVRIHWCLPRSPDARGQPIAGWPRRCWRHCRMHNAAYSTSDVAASAWGILNDDW